MAKQPDNHVRIWCATCRDYVLMTGWRDELGSVHITPEILKRHRKEAGHE